MTIPRRTDQPFGDNPRAHQQNVLADLPHLGDCVAAPRTEPVPRKKKSSHPAFAEIAEEFDQEPVRKPAKRKKRRFVDQAHVSPEMEDIEAEEWQPPRRKPLAERREPTQRQPAKRNQGGKSNPRSNRTKRKAPIGSLIAAAQNQLAPFSGLITTAALVAAAGLMFVIMNNRQPPIASVDEFALPAFRVSQSGRVEQSELDQAATEGMPPLVEAEITPEVMEPTIDETLPTETSPAETSAVVADPVIEQIVEPTPQLGVLSFPVTSSPLALDYSKATLSTDPDLQALPVVAERQESQGSEPINR